MLLQSFTLVNPWSSLKQFVQPESAEGAKLFDGFLAILSDMMIPAVLCFVGYSLIGFICNGNFVYGDMNGLAIAVGGAFARLVKYEQCDFHGRPQASNEV